MPIPFPFILGADFAGVVDDAGSATGFQKGDRVFGRLKLDLKRSGALAEYTSVESMVMIGLWCWT
jgi:NADPH:quinone reductase-like Zn-dependent oxidoreductase